MKNILRWHITRIHPTEKPTGDEAIYVEVTITPQKQDILKAAKISSAEYLPTIKEDNLEWWDPDEDNHLEGFTYEEDLVNALNKRNLIQESEDTKETLKERKIGEDMVFLELFKDESEFLDTYQHLLSKSGMPEVTSLVYLDGARWMDFTQQARTMSLNLYRQVLSEKIER